MGWGLFCGVGLWNSGVFYFSREKRWKNLELDMDDTEETVWLKIQALAEF